MTHFKLSILCLTYNHAAFVRQALESFVMQKTNFPFEVLVHDDGSTDATQEIIREYETKYPDIIKPICQTENQWSKGVAISKVFQFPRVTGQYVAMCEGDDYWTDPMKLQKQVDFLDANPDYSVCFHPVEVRWEGEPERTEVFPTPELRFQKTTLEAEDLVKRNFMQTNSVVYRWVFPEKESLEDYPEGILPGDWYLHLVHAKHGKIGFLDDVMAVYRRHPEGLWQNHPLLRHGVRHLRFFDAVDRLFDFRYHAQIEANKRELLLLALDSSATCDDYRELTRMAQDFEPLQVVFFRQILVPHKIFTFRHRLVNRLAKLLGVGPVFVDSWWMG